MRRVCRVLRQHRSAQRKNVMHCCTRECLAIRIDGRLKITDVIDVLSDLFTLRGVPNHICSDSGHDLVAKAVQDWIHRMGASTAYIARRSPWENAYIESFNSRMRDELLYGEISYTLREARTETQSQRGPATHPLDYQLPLPTRQCSCPRLVGSVRRCSCAC